jgi:hypothetical protein
VKTALTEHQRKQLFYMRWYRTSPEAQLLRAPENYTSFTKHTNHYKKVREAFNLAWITHKLTEE